MPLRLDQQLVDLGLAPSAHQAQLLIRAGQVRVNGQLWDKPSQAVPKGAEVRLLTQARFVSRGGEKLHGALEHFQPHIAGRVCLDGGIATGGFTDCLLQRGATRVYGIDVGYGQVAWSLRQDPRVVLKERTNLRYLTPEALYKPGDLWPDLAVVDVSFISLTKLLHPLYQLLQAPREAVLLIKPQFECERDQSTKGVVRDPQIHQNVITQVKACALALGWQVQGLTWSPLRGPEGNIEYWIWLGTHPQEVDVDQVVQGAHQYFLKPPQSP